MSSEKWRRVRYINSFELMLMETVCHVVKAECLKGPYSAGRSACF